MPEARRRRLLAALPQCPFDPASGAARSARSVCELLARSGWEVEVVATTGSESGGAIDGAGLAAPYGIAVAEDPPDGLVRRARLRLEHRGVGYRLLDTRGYSIDEARVHLAGEMDRLVAAQAAERPPAVMLTYGSSEDEVRRRAKVRAGGAKVVFFLRNLAYFHQRSFAEVDAILTPSRYLSEEYRVRSGIRATALPPCLAAEEILAPCFEPVFSTFMNPTAEKGLRIFLEIVEAAARTGREIPFLAVEARGSGESLAAAARSLGIELAGAKLQVARTVHQPKQIYGVTRVLLVPSTGPDAGPRVIAEAQMNGIPVIASDRGGLAELVGQGGAVLPAMATAAEWLEAIGKLYDDPEAYRAARMQSDRAGARYRNGEVDREYVAFFQSVAEGRIGRV